MNKTQPIDEIIRTLAMNCTSLREAILDHRRVSIQDRQKMEDLLYELSWKNKQIAWLEASESVADKAQALLNVRVS